MCLREQIVKIIQDNVRGYVDRIRQKPELVEWISNNTLATECEFPVQVYSAITQESNICKYGKKKGFKSINAGFAFCGIASICKCNLEKQSAAMKQHQRNITPEERKIIRKKREETSLTRTGFANPFNDPIVQKKARDMAVAKTRTRGKLFVPTENKREK